ncbi:hypothetical protein [Ammoniphilus sp. 3BR4]|uniref:hypothetical protein n=1 Tax=Ammoniphilus sp. 3BR4 TaxID=3158265 RepID=UPI00346743B8
MKKWMRITPITILVLSILLMASLWTGINSHKKYEQAADTNIVANIKQAGQTFLEALFHRSDSRDRNVKSNLIIQELIYNKTDTTHALSQL